MLLPAATAALDLEGVREELVLRTIRQDTKTLHGASVSFRISSLAQPHKSYLIKNAFTAEHLRLSNHSFPMEALQRRYRHLRDLPLQPLKGACHLLLIGTDHPHLITPIEPVRLGLVGGPAAVRTRLGWTLQGPVSITSQMCQPSQCLFTSISPPMDELF